MIRVVHYVNQFFGQIGGEGWADLPPTLAHGPVGFGHLLENALKGQAEVVATVICGDNYFKENISKASDVLLKLINLHKPDAFIAGPAFNAGRYGFACGEMCRRVKAGLGIPVIPAMFPDNPGVDLYKRVLHIVETTDTVAGMDEAMDVIGRLLMKMCRGEPIGKPSEEGYITRGVRKNVLTAKRPSLRAVELLLKKMKSEPFETEIAFPARIPSLLQTTAKTRSPKI